MKSLPAGGDIEAWFWLKVPLISIIPLFPIMAMLFPEASLNFNFGAVGFPRHPQSGSSFPITQSIFKSQSLSKPSVQADSPERVESHNHVPEFE